MYVCYIPPVQTVTTYKAQTAVDIAEMTDIGGIYLEDLFVLPEYRGKGYGKALLKKLAQIAVERGCGRFEWSCLDWNKPSIDFYLSLNAKPMDEWTTYRLAGESLTAFAKEK